MFADLHNCIYTKYTHGLGCTQRAHQTPDYVPGRRYPLVFQTHGFNEKECLTDGAFPTAMAARPMAARGMLVLQVREIRTKQFGWLQAAALNTLVGAD